MSVIAKIGAATQATGGLYGMIDGIAGISAKRNLKNNKKLADYAANIGEQQAQSDYARSLEMYDHQFGKQEAFSKEMFNKQNEYNTPQAQMARLQSAGLNPALAISGGAGGTSGSVAPANASSSTEGSGRPQVQAPDSSVYGAMMLKSMEILGSSIKALQEDKRVDNESKLADAKEGLVNEMGKKEWYNNLLKGAIFKESMGGEDQSARIIRRKDGRYGTVMFNDDNPSLKTAINEALSSGEEIGVKQSTQKANEAIASLNNEKAKTIWSELIIAQANGKAQVAESKARELSHLFGIGEHRNEYFWYKEGKEAAETLLKVVGKGGAGAVKKGETVIRREGGRQVRTDREYRY